MAQSPDFTPISVSGNRVPGQAAITWDTAQVQMQDSTTSLPDSVVDATELSNEEIEKLNSTTPANNPDIGTPIETGPTTSETNLADVPVLSGVPWTGPLPSDQNNPNASNATPTSPDTITNTKPIPNRLKEYPSYIYGLSLHLLTDEQYNKVVETQTYTPANVLVASAGRYSSTFPRNEFFAEDFYFEDLSLTTIISPNDNSRNTNAIETSFTLIEPYGFTFMERLLKVADAVQSRNYLDMPYLLQIDFFAIDDAGNIRGSIEDLRKRIPIKLVKMDVRVSAKGAEYKITAIPFNHSAYDSTSVTTPANFEVVAGTVAEFFQSIEGTADDPAATAAYSATQREQSTTPSATSQNKPTTPTTSPASKTASGTSYTRVKSYGSAINAWYLAMKNDRKISVNDTYRFEFPPDKDGLSIGNSLFTDKVRHTPKRTAMKDNRTPGDVATMLLADLGGERNIYDVNKVIFQVNYGTTIEKLLEYIIRNSDYVQKQLVVPEEFKTKEEYDAAKAKLAKEPLNWFRIIPTVRLKEFDSIKKVWGREITYSIVPYKIYNLRIDVGPQGVQLYPVKEYNYIYTGKNDDVFDFDINFNALYYNQTTAYRDSMSDLNPTAESSITDYQYQNAPNYSGAGTPPTGVDYNAVMPLVMKPVVQNSKQAATGGATNAKEVASLDMTDSIMTNSQADMLGIKLKILGDPDYIKQDDVFYRPTLNNINIAVKPSSDPRLLPDNGSLDMDSGGLYVQLLFRTPVDIDESTGLMKYDSNYQHSVFSGLYQVISVTSNFRAGQFTQELDMVRMPRQQAYDYATLGKNVSDNRKELAGQPMLNQDISAPAPIPSLLVSGSGEPQSPADAADSAIDQTPGQYQDQSIAQGPDFRGGYYGDQVEPGGGGYQQDLMALNETAETVPISSQNEPQAIVPDFKIISVRGNRVPGAAAI